MGVADLWELRPQWAKSKARTIESRRLGGGPATGLRSHLSCPPGYRTYDPLCNHKFTIHFRPMLPVLLSTATRTRFPTSDSVAARSIPFAPLSTLGPDPAASSPRTWRTGTPFSRTSLPCTASPPATNTAFSLLHSSGRPSPRPTCRTRPFAVVRPRQAVPSRTPAPPSRPQPAWSRL